MRNDVIDKNDKNSTQEGIYEPENSYDMRRNGMYAVGAIGLEFQVPECTPLGIFCMQAPL